MKSGAAAEIGTIEHRQSDTIASTIEYNRESKSIAVSSAIVPLLFFRCLVFFFFSCLFSLFFRAGMSMWSVESMCGFRDTANVEPLVLLPMSMLF